MNHTLVLLRTKGESWERREWAEWECSCGAYESGYRYALAPGGAVCGAATEWAEHVVVALATEVVYNSRV